MDVEGLRQRMLHAARARELELLSSVSLKRPGDSRRTLPLL